MNISNRLKKIENGLNKPGDSNPIVWDFSKTTTEQLSKLETLLKTENQTEAENFTAELISGGFLSRRINGKEIL